jgi:putative ABC transport system permease protein
MKFLPFVLKHLRRNWIRTTSTILAMAVCIFLFCTLRTFLKAMDDAREMGNTTRLVTRHAVSLVYNVPLPYEAQIAQVPGVKRVAISTWFGGSLLVKKEAKDGKPEDTAAAGSPDPTASPDPKKKAAQAAGPDFSKFFTNLAVEDEPYFAMHPELKISPEDMQAYRQDMRGCIIGRALANRFKWKAGDTFFLESFIPPYRRRDGPFEFIVRGIYDADMVREPAADNAVMYFHYKYLYESTGQRVSAGLYVVELEDPKQAATVAKAIDERFKNSEAETQSETEAAFRADFLSMIGNLALLFNSIGMAVIFTSLLVTANTMSMGVRERRTEIAVLKTLGFSGTLVMGLIVAEALAIATFGGGLGLGFSALIIRLLPDVPGIGQMVRGFPNFGLHASVTAQGIGIALVMGLAAGFLPALNAYKSKIVEMLRQT